MYGNRPKITYIVGAVINGKAIGGMAFHSPIWWIKFTGDSVIFAAKYEIQGKSNSPLSYYAINLLTGKITSNQAEVLKSSGNSNGIPKWVKGIPGKYKSSIKSN